jgi:predicted HicB family RNase H-like nuclease
LGGKENYYRANYWIPKDLHIEFKVLAVKQGKSMSEIIEKLIKEYVKKEGK